MLAAEYAQYYKIDPQGPRETDDAFKSRVAGKLREMGHLIEAHEAFQDERYEESGDVMTGIIGAVAQAMQGVDYGHKQDGERQIGDDFAAGVVVQAPKRDDSLVLLLAALLFGGDHDNQAR